MYYMSECRDAFHTLEKQVMCCYFPAVGSNLQTPAEKLLCKVFLDGFDWPLKLDKLNP